MPHQTEQYKQLLTQVCARHPEQAETIMHATRLLLSRFESAVENFTQAVEGLCQDPETFALADALVFETLRTLLPEE